MCLTLKECRKKTSSQEENLPSAAEPRKEQRLSTEDGWGSTDRINGLRMTALGKLRRYQDGTVEEISFNETATGGTLLTQKRSRFRGNVPQMSEGGGRWGFHIDKS